MTPLFDLPLFYQALLALPFGLIIGSFLNVVIHRVPRAESVAFPASHCGSCGAAVKPYDNIPVLSYLLLRGKCRACRTHFSWRYPLVEAMVGGLFFALAYRHGLTWMTIAEMIFVAIIVALTFIDGEHMLLPDVITYPALLFALVAITAVTYASAASGGQSFPLNAWLPEIFSASLVPWIGFVAFALAVPALWCVDKVENVLFGKYHDFDEVEETEEEKVFAQRWEQKTSRVVRATIITGVVVQILWWIVTATQLPFSLPASYGLVQAAVGALVGGGVLWLFRAAFFYLRGVEGMGLGDIKLMAFVGAFLGWQLVLFVFLFGTFLGSLVGGLAAVISRQGMKFRFPFGVPLGLATILTLFYGQAILSWYLSMFPR